MQTTSAFRHQLLVLVQLPVLAKVLVSVPELVHPMPVVVPALPILGRQQAVLVGPNHLLVAEEQTAGAAVAARSFVVAAAAGVLELKVPTSPPPVVRLLPVHSVVVSSYEQHHQWHCQAYPLQSELAVPVAPVQVLSLVLAVDPNRSRSVAHRSHILENPSHSSCGKVLRLRQLSVRLIARAAAEVVPIVQAEERPLEQKQLVLRAGLLLESPQSSDLSFGLELEHPSGLHQERNPLPVVELILSSVARVVLWETTDRRGQMLSTCQSRPTQREDRMRDVYDRLLLPLPVPAESMVLAVMAESK